MWPACGVDERGERGGQEIINTHHQVLDSRNDQRQRSLLIEEFHDGYQEC